MGRRARTNGSPIDSALEKYHHDIGNRLSGVFVPPLPTSDEPNDFGMLTLDTRHKHGLLNVRPSNNHPTSGPGGKSSTLPIALEASSPNSRDSNLAATSATEKSSSLPTSTAHSHSDSINSNNKEKRGLVDKVTRALFQRKHTCSRCQMRSRSCLPNKTFNGTEKHYMCGNCRENSHAIKHLFTVPLHKPPTTAQLTESLSFKNSSHPLNHMHCSQAPRKQLNDSGYDTVTSCSTLASAYSAFTSAAPASEDAMGKVLPAPCPAMLGHYEEDDSGLQHFLAPGGVLKQIRPKHTKDYDGYLPGSQHHHIEGGVVVLRSPLSDTTNSGQQQQQPKVQPQHSESSSTNTQQQHHHQQQPSGPKMCYTCRSASKPCFRLPWAGGWLCEDCMDAMC